MAHATSEDFPLPTLVSLFETTVNTICPFGDVVLVVKDDFLPTARFQVSSCILAMSSKVFAALFSKNFAEGQKMCARTPGENVEIEIMDSPTDMKHLLRMLHLKSPHDTGQIGLSTSSLLGLAIAIDKYDCIEALRLPTESLLGEYDIAKSRLDHLTTAAYVLDNPYYFFHFTRTLVMTQTAFRPKDFDPLCLQLLPSNLISSLFSQQSIAWQNFAIRVTAFIDKFSEACNVADRPELIHKLFDELKYGLWPLAFHKFSIQSLLDRVNSIAIPTISIDNTINKQISGVECGWGVFNDPGSSDDNFTDAGWGWGTAVPKKRKKSPKPQYRSYTIDAPTHADLKTMSDGVQELVVGVCLDCIRAKECRNRHLYYWEGSTKMESFKAYDSDGDSYWGKVGIEDDHGYDFVMSSRYPGYWDDCW